MTFSKLNVTLNAPMSGAVEEDSCAALLDRIREGNTAALDVLARRYLPPYQRWAEMRLPPGDGVRIRDWVLDVVKRALTHLATFRPARESALQAHLREAVARRVNEELRKARRYPRPASERRLEESSRLEQTLGTDLIEQYEEALSTLNEEDREAIISRVELGLTYQEIAATMGKISTEAARLAVSRALLSLASQMKALGQTAAASALKPRSRRVL